jgi:hypothetical protein
MGRREQFTVGELTVTDKIIGSNQVFMDDRLKTNFVNTTMLDLGAPALEVDNRYVVSVDMKVGSYTIANASPADGSSRNILVTITQTAADDTMGTLLVTGTDYLGAALTETITPVANTITQGVKCFKTVTSVVGAAWVVNTGADKIKVGFGALVQIPMYLSAAGKVLLTIFNTAIINAPTITVDTAVLAKNTINVSSSTYDGTKKLKLLVNMN